jgi:hypothetical protein
VANSPAHRFGQQIGELLEELVGVPLLAFSKERGLALDSKSGRISSNRGRKVTWTDKFANSHDLDFVVVRPSNELPEGRPIAFIEVAWRRYTKHSKNKAQEIQGAVLPVAERYQTDRPFLGAVLAGEFTSNSLVQLRSVGFKVLHLPYRMIVDAFGACDIDVRFDETTPDSVFARTVALVDALGDSGRAKVIDSLSRANAAAIARFYEDLAAAVDRQPTRIVIIPLFGSDVQFETVSEALHFLEAGKLPPSGPTVRKYEVVVNFSNGDHIDASYSSVHEAARFLRYVVAK